MTSGATSTCDVTRTHLELRGAESLRPVRRPHASATVRRLYPIGAAEYRALYSLVGERWFWHDRLVWTDDELGAYLAAPNVHVWLLGVENRTAGYFELQEHSGGAVEVMYFGLLAEYMGRGLGGWLLSRAAEEALALGAERVILNTCTLDAPQALPNYLARGFAIVREERYQVEVPVPLRHSARSPSSAAASAASATAAGSARVTGTGTA